MLNGPPSPLITTSSDGLMYPCAYLSTIQGEVGWQVLENNDVACFISLDLSRLREVRWRDDDVGQCCPTVLTSVPISSLVSQKNCKEVKAIAFETHM